MLHLFYPHNFANVFRHENYMKACLSGQPVELSSKEISNLVDHRYFYDKFDSEDRLMGCYICGLARDAVTAELRANNVDFADREFLKSLPSTSITRV